MPEYAIPTVEVPVPAAEDLHLDAYCPLGETFDHLVAERQELKRWIESHETRVAELDGMIASALDLAGQKNVVWNKEYLVSRREGSKPRQTLDRVLLLEAGVTPEQIQHGTKLGKPGKGGVAIRKLAEKPKEEEPAN